jgi:hypothetical protein
MDGVVVGRGKRGGGGNTLIKVCRHEVVPARAHLFLLPTRRILNGVWGVREAVHGVAHVRAHPTWSPCVLLFPRFLVFILTNLLTPQPPPLPPTFPFICHPPPHTHRRHHHPHTHRTPPHLLPRTMDGIPHTHATCPPPPPPNYSTTNTDRANKITGGHESKGGQRTRATVQRIKMYKSGGKVIRGVNGQTITPAPFQSWVPSGT